MILIIDNTFFDGKTYKTFTDSIGIYGVRNLSHFTIKAAQKRCDVDSEKSILIRPGENDLWPCGFKKLIFKRGDLLGKETNPKRGGK